MDTENPEENNFATHKMIIVFQFDLRLSQRLALGKMWLAIFIWYGVTNNERRKTQMQIIP